MKNDKAILELKDGAIMDIEDDMTYYPGCPTCDYGAEYCNDIYIYLTKMYLHASFTDGCDYPCTVKDMMRLFCCNLEKIKEMTEMEFIEWFKSETSSKWKAEFRCEDLENLEEVESEDEE